MVIEKVNCSGFSMEYFKFGSGKKTMVILPGISVQSVMKSADAVAREYNVMVDDFTVYVFDRRAELPDEYSVYDMARDTVEAFEILGLKDIYLFGASQGGMMAMSIAINHPQLVKKLALGSTTAKITPEQLAGIDYWVSLAKQQDREALYLEFGRRLYPEEMFNTFRNFLVSAAESITDDELARFAIIAGGSRGYDVMGELCKIKCPVFAAASDDDKVFGCAIDEIAKAFEGNGNFEMHVYSGYGHAMYDTAPDFRKRLYNFFM